MTVGMAGKFGKKRFLKDSKIQLPLRKGSNCKGSSSDSVIGKKKCPHPIRSFKTHQKVIQLKN